MLNESRGIKLFQLLTTNVMELTKRIRHQDDQKMRDQLMDGWTVMIWTGCLGGGVGWVWELK